MGMWRKLIGESTTRSTRAICILANVRNEQCVTLKKSSKLQAQRTNYNDKTIEIFYLTDSL